MYYIPSNKIPQCIHKVNHIWKLLILSSLPLRLPDHLLTRIFNLINSTFLVLNSTIIDYGISFMNKILKSEAWLTVKNNTVIVWFWMCGAKAAVLTFLNGNLWQERKKRAFRTTWSKTTMILKRLCKVA